jgi:hypothetical protein
MGFSAGSGIHRQNDGWQNDKGKEEEIIGDADANLPPRSYHFASNHFASFPVQFQETKRARATRDSLHMPPTLKGF